MTPEEIAAEDAAERLAEEVQRRRKKPKAPTGPGVRTALYRLRDAAGQLLYVGISEDPLRRWPEHAKDKSWWPEVASFSQEWHDDRLHAQAAEAIAIRTERPLHNVAHNKRRPAA
ncbi:GIY-YIG nuclease family protein [Streptomyces globisporus]|uniref:GIY-YIG nuclease family protein n=1 Tax=Streptomyces globisporus TaxID=1908 RepID=UPI0036F6A492